MGLHARLNDWSRLQSRIERDDEADAHAVIERQHDTWQLSSDHGFARVPHSVGMDYLATLLASPGTDITVGELVGFRVVSVPDDVLDATALRTLRHRIRELDAAADAAALKGEQDEAARLQRELEDLTAHLRVTVGPTGRSRRFDDGNERAHTSVQKAIRRAIAAISRDCSEMGEALRAAVKTGYRCRYDPVPGAPERWDVRRH